MLHEVVGQPLTITYLSQAISKPRSRLIKLSNLRRGAQGLRAMDRHGEVSESDRSIKGMPAMPVPSVPNNKAGGLAK